MKTSSSLALIQSILGLKSSRLFSSTILKGSRAALMARISDIASCGGASGKCDSSWPLSTNHQILGEALTEYCREFSNERFRQGLGRCVF